jgi:DNA-binding CsgD family transcriptional regulator
MITPSARRDALAMWWQQMPADEELPTTRRLALHRAAAADLGGDQAWPHRVAAATSVDESLAEELESAARCCAPASPGRPGPALLLEWASALSAHPGNRERRLLLAAIQRTCAEDPGPPGLWSRVQACPPSALRSAALAGWALLEGRSLDAEYHLGHAATDSGGNEAIAAGGAEHRRALEAATHGLTAALRLSQAQGEETVAQASAGLAAVPDDRGLQRCLTRLLAAGRCYVQGPRSARDTLLGERTAPLTADEPLPAGEPATASEPREPATVLALGCYHVLAGEPRQAIEELSTLNGDGLGDLPPELTARGHQWLALAWHLLGAHPQADEHARSAISAAQPAQTQPAQTQWAETRPSGAYAGGPNAARAMIAAQCGDWATAEEHLLRARAQGSAGHPDDAVLADIADAAIAHAHGTLVASHPALARLADDKASDAARVKFRGLWIALHAEALVESGSLDDAQHALAALGAQCEEVPYLRVAAGRLSGRLAERRRDPAAARRHYEAVLDLPEQCRTVPFQLGLLEQCHGRLLCALGETAGGSVRLGRARDLLASLGATPYARRCGADADLAASPGRAGGSGPAALTGRERAVAALVASGLTNQEAADRLFIGVKTVEYHLSRIYAKLGISSRRQLARSGLAAPDPGPPDARGWPPARRPGPG